MALRRARAREAELLIENGRLQAERDEARDQQQATADVLRIIAGWPTDLRPVLETILDTAMRLCDAAGGAIWRLVGEDQVSEIGARRTAAGGIHTAVYGGPHAPSRRTGAGRAFLERRSVHIADLAALTPEDGYNDAFVQFNLKNDSRTWLGTPLLHHGKAVGVLLVVRLHEPRPFAPQQVALLETFASQAAIAIENARLFSELQESNRSFKEALEQQTATAEVLQIIAGSPTNLEPALMAIVDGALRLCDATFAAIAQLEGEALVLQAFRHGAGDAQAAPAGEQRVPDRAFGAGRVLLDARTVHLPDLAALAAEDEHAGFDPTWVATELRAGCRTWLGTPLLREGKAIGQLTVARGGDVAQPFTAAEIALLETFAAQAVIALENTRLFTQLQQENTRKQQELERARGIQERLLPATVPTWPGQLEIAYRFQPAVETSGDFYDVITATPTTPEQGAPLQIAVADVAGKGMGAALVMSLARAGLRAGAALPTARSPAATAHQVSDRLYRDVGSASFVACALATVEPPAGSRKYPRLRLVNAGQPSVLLCRNGSVTELEPPGERFPLGAVADVSYHDLEAQLWPGDTIVFASDGLPEAPAQALLPALTAPLAPPTKTGDLFSFDRLAQCAAYWAQHATSAEGVAAGLWSDIIAWCGPESHHDDMTLLVLRVPDGTRAQRGG